VPARSYEGGALFLREVQRLRQQGGGVFTRRLAHTALQVVDAAHAQAGALGQLRLGQSGRLAGAAQLLAKACRDRGDPAVSHGAAPFPQRSLRQGQA
jgi:hypothetical protein